MSAKTRISAQKDKKDMKRRLALQADELVIGEVARRRQADEMVGKMMGVIDDMRGLTPLLRTVLLRMAAQGGAESKEETVEDVGGESGQS